MMSGPESLKVIKVFNNNVVLGCQRPSGREVVCVGRGLGFGKQEGRTYPWDELSVERTFVLEDPEEARNYRALVSNLDSRVLGVVAEFIALAVERLGEPLNSHLHIALPDHLSFALQRVRDGLEIFNPFLAEIRSLYPEEYAIALEGREMVRQRLGWDMPEGELGFLAMHIHGARRRGALPRSLRYTALTKELIDTLEAEVGRPVMRSGLDYARLLTHFRFAFERIEKEEAIVNPLTRRLMEDYPGVFRVAWALTGIIARELHKPVPEDETGYIAIHLLRFLLPDQKLPDTQQKEPDTQQKG